MNNKYLWKFFWDCGRQGEVEGLFVATENEIKADIGKDVYFGEILGKHSEVYGTLDWDDVEKINLDSVSTERVAKLLGETWSGYNPLEYIQHFCKGCEESYNVDEFDLKVDKCVYCRDNPEE